MQPYYLGIDVSKGYADFVILDAAKNPVIQNFQLDDTFQGHCFLYEKLQTFFKERSEAVLYAAVESTGGYENNWFSSLVKFQDSLKLKTARLNPTGVHANGKAGMARIITDKISAHNIAEYLISHPEKVNYEHQDSLASLRKQWSFIQMLTKQCTQLLNQLEALIYSANPEMLIFCRDGVPGWVLHLYKRYPTAALLAKARPSSVAKIPFISIERAQLLVENAQKSVASATDSITGQLITATAKQIMHLKETIKMQTAIIAQNCPVPEVALLKTFSGIKDYSAIGLMLEIQTVQRFSSVKKLASFFGLHPVFKTSGDGSAGFHMSKTGRKEPRRILFMVALTAIRTNALIRNLYQEHVAKGMCKMAALGLCMHKILRIIYGMLKHNKAFDSAVDIANRQKMPVKQKCRQDKNRRFQAFDAKAPVSRRQNLKRRERESSQNVNNVQSGIDTLVPIPV